MHCLRGFHNAIKRTLLEDAMKRETTKTILDIGCGVGGDLLKYIQCGATYVLGVDIDLESIEEAKRRLQGVKVPQGMRIQFYAVKDTARDLTSLLLPKTIGVISCQFAMHFIWDALTPEFFAVLRRSMVQDGVFIGTILNGDMLAKALGDKEATRTEHYVARKDGEYVDFQLLGNTRFFDKPSRELILYSEDVIGRFMDNGFSLVYWKNFRDYASPSYPRDLLEVSSLYCCFMFRMQCCTDRATPKPA